jgi:hypothetical protein
MSTGLDGISNEELVRRAILSLANRNCRFCQPLWASVMRAFLLGSVFAQELCRKHGFDPDMKVRRR